MSKEEDLYEWGKRQSHFLSSHSINYYGTTHGFDSATRRAREWADEYELYQKGIIKKEPKYKVRRLPDNEALFRGLIKKGNKVLAWYEFIK